MLTHKQLVKKLLKLRGAKAEYDAQAEEFALLDELLRARQERFDTSRSTTHRARRGTGCRTGRAL